MSLEYSALDENTIIELAGEKTAAELAALFTKNGTPRTARSVYQKARSLGVRFRGEPEPWDDSELDVLNAWAGKESPKAIAGRLPTRTKADVLHMARFLDLDLTVLATFEKSERVWGRVPDDKTQDVADALNGLAKFFLAEQKGDCLVQTILYAWEQAQLAQMPRKGD